MRLEYAESVNRYGVYFGHSVITSSALAANKVGLSLSTLARFLSKINYVPGTCWEWSAAKYRLGYGMFNLCRRSNGTQVTTYAHRLAYELANGPLGDFSALHVCDNRACCNPDHLYAGTQRDNMQDRCERSPGWNKPSIPLDKETRARIVRECMNSRERGVVARLAREHGIDYEKFRAMVLREKKREFLANATGVAAAVR